MQNKRLPALQYLRSELGPIVLTEWKTMGEKDKDQLKQWAEEEQDALGLVAAK